MPKRKRNEPSGASSSPELSADRALSRRKKLCAQRISAAQKPIASALRLAAGFERQKHSRRKKAAQTSNDTKAISRLDAEYAVLKQLDLAKLAEQHLRRTIAKVKSLRESNAIPESAKVAEKGGNDAALLNVQARLYKVDAVRKAVDEAIEELKEVVGVGAQSADSTTTHREVEKSTQKKTKIQQEEEVEDEDGSEWDSDMLAAFNARVAAPSSAEEDSEDSLSEGHRPPSAEPSESEDYEESDDEDKSVSEDAKSLPFHNFDSEDEDQGTSNSSVSQESDGDSMSNSETGSMPIPPSKDKRKALELEKPSGSTFFPSLSHAAYLSGSESEASDLDTDLAPRKNRRGQKARQKIWEQKYGAGAKHVQKQETERNSGWDAKRGAVGNNKRGREGRRVRPGRAGPQQSGANEVPLGVRKVKRDDAGPLHPSWQAAKAAKERKVDVKPQGKKLVFD